MAAPTENPADGEVADENVADENVADAVALLWERVREVMVDRLETLESMGLALLEGRHDPDLAERSLQAAHKLHGSLGTFGRARGSVLAAELESLLEAGHLEGPRLHHFTELVVALRTEMEESAGAAASARSHGSGTSTSPITSAAAVAPGTVPGTPADTATGLPSRSGGEERLAAMLGLAERFQVPVAVALLCASGPAGAGAAEVASTAARLSSKARPGDLVARWSDAGVLLALYGLTRAGAADRLRVLLGRFGTDEGAWHIGVAEYPRDGSKPAELLEHAEQAAGAAELEGTLFQDAATNDGLKVSDVVIVEDDEALGLLLVRSLEDRGYTTLWIRDGMEALHLLSGEPPALRGRVLLLDIGLPGLDGLSLLRQLGQSGVVPRTRVVMLTARSAESEVVKSLELGAFDHVPKPFSIAELTHRVRRALEDRRFE